MFVGYQKPLAQTCFKVSNFDKTVDTKMFQDISYLQITCHQHVLRGVIYQANGHPKKGCHYMVPRHFILKAHAVGMFENILP